MSKERAKRPDRPRWRRARSGSLALLAAFASLAAGCGHDWDAFDPRLGGPGGSGAAGSGGTGVAGSSSTAGTAGAGGASTAGAGGSSTAGAGGSSTAGTAGSSAAGSGGGGPAPCGGTSLIADDFSGSDPGDIWQIVGWGGGSASEVGGEVVIPLQANKVDTGAVFVTNRYYDLRNDSVSVEVTDVGTTSGTVYATFQIGPDQDNMIEITEQSGTLFMNLRLGGNKSALSMLPYDPLAHRYWRVQESGGITYWQTSADGGTWKEQAQAPSSTLFPLDEMRVWIAGGTDLAEPSPGEVHFDRLNGGGAPKGKWCPTSALSDDFGDGQRSRAWARTWWDQDGMLSEDGTLALTFIPGTSAKAFYVSSSAYDLTGSSVSLEVPVVPAASTQSSARIRLVAAGDNLIDMEEDAGMLNFTVAVGGVGTTVGNKVYSAMDDRWWQIREASGTVYWETSPDGKGWVIQEKTAVPIPIDALDIVIGGGTYAAQAAPGDAHFDNLNLPPP